MTIILTLLGYGSDFGYLEQFQLAPEDLQRTPLDFLLRSYRAIFLMIDFTSSIKTKLGWGMIWRWAVQVRWAIGLACLLGFGAGYAFTSTGRSNIRRAAETVVPFKPLAWLAARLRWLLLWIARNWTAGWLAGVVAALTAGSFIAALPFIFGALFLFLASLSFVVVGLVPLLPVSAAAEAARKQVIDPTTCRQLLQIGDSQTIGARCVRVVRQGCELGRGRYIEQSSNRVWLLYEPPVQVPGRQTLKVFSVPLDGNVIEEVDSEGPQSQPTACVATPMAQRTGGVSAP
jgi:hypothetical protein